MPIETTAHTSNQAAAANPRSRRRATQMLLLLAFTIMTLAFQTTVSQAQESAAPNSVAPNSLTVANLSGSWVVSLVGTTGCGQAAMRAYFTLGTSGKTNSATLTTHAQCEDVTDAGQTFSIDSLSSDGHGTAHLSCGAGCGWDFQIQVAPGNNTFSLVDVSPENPNNYLAGVAYRKQ